MATKHPDSAPRLGGVLISNQVVAELLEQLRNGIWQDTDHLPPELELANRLNVSRTVVRDALSELERAGYIERVRGIGTVINRDVVNLARRMDQKFEFTQMIRARGMQPNSDDLRVSRHTADADAAQALNISLDTLQPEKFAYLTRRGNLRDTLDGIAAAEAAGFEHLKLNCVLMGGVNDDEIEDFVRLTQVRPISVRFIELMPMGACVGWDKARFLSAGAVLDRVPELEPAGTDGVSRLYRIPGAAGTVGLIEPMSHAFCAECSRIRITADGKLKPCLHADMEIALRGLHGEALLDAIRQGIARKPERHALTRDGQSHAGRCMSEIGG